MRTSVNGANVFSSGTIVSQQNEEIALFPFSDDAEFSVKIELNFDSGESSSPIELIPIGTKTQLLRFNRDYYSSTSFSTSKEIQFAISDDGTIDYFLNVAIHLIGTKERHTIFLAFCITERAH